MLARGWAPVRLHGLRPDGTCRCRLGALCKAPGKHPSQGDGWQSQPVPTPDEVIRLFAAYRAGENVGVRTGAASGLLVVDVDHVQSWEALTQDQDVPRTYTVRTGSGGLHLYFAHPGGIGNSASKLAPGVDVRGDGGQVVAPPSRTPAGAYVVVDDAKPAPLPEWLAERLQRPEPRRASAAPAAPADAAEAQRLAAYTETARQAELARLYALQRPWQPGAGWDTTVFEVACALLDLAESPWAPYSVEQAEQDVRDHAPTDEGWTAADVDRKIDSAHHRASAGRGKPYPPPRMDLAAEVATWTNQSGVQVDQQSQRSAEAPAARDENEGGKASASTLLVRLGEERFTLGQSAEGEPFALPKDGPRVVRMLRGGQDSLRAELSEAFFRRYGKAPSQSALADALSVLDGIAARANPVPLALRVAEVDGTYWLDLGDSTGRAVRLDPGHGWEVCDSAPVLFRRTPLTGPLPAPTRGGSLSELWEHLNVSEADRAVVAAILVAALVPDIPHVVVVIDGEQGAGKSTGTKRLAGLIDPSPVQLRRPPTNLETWTTAAAGSWVVAVDNVSTLQPWLSDALCRASTGDGDVQRRLYTNGDLYVVAFRRCVMLNGIDLAGIRDDLADRAVTVHLERLTGHYRDDAELAAAWQQAHPRILGALLDLAVQVLALRHTVALPDPPRMVDFARILAAVDSVLGTDGMSRYRALATDLAADAVMSDPVLAAISDAVRTEWSGTAGHLLDLISRDLILSDRYQPREWPKDARAMSSLLRRRAPSLRRLGWEIEDLGRGGKDKQLRWRLTPPLEAGITAGSGGHRAPAAGISAGDARQGEAPLTCENASASPVGGHGGRQDAGFSLLNSEEEAGEAPAGHPYGEGSHLTPAMPAVPDWQPFAEAAL
jgi:hypothetical protein